MRWSRSVTVRLMLLVAVVFVLTLGGLHWLHFIEKERVREASVERRRERELLFDRVRQLDGERMRILANDYSRWTEFVDFVEGRNPGLADDSLEPGLEMFGADVGWALRPDGSVVWARSGGDPRLTAPAWPAALATHRERFRHWFAGTPLGILELYSAPIQPDEDLQRRTEPRGWFVFGQLWDDAHLERLEQISTTSIRLVPGAGDDQRDPAPGRVRFSRPLPGWDGPPVATAMVEGAIPGAAEAARLSRFQMTIFGGGAGITVLLIAWALIVWVHRPLRSIGRALESGDERELAFAERSSAEFAGAASALRAFLSQREELERLARHDALTGLPNRALLHDRLCVAVARAERDRRPLALLVMDLDGFKAVNDTLGHEAGDATLKQVGARLAGLVRHGDTAARIGGDEFVALLPGLTGPADAEIVARRIVDSIAKPFFVGSRDVHIGVSIGIAVFDEDGDTPDALLKLADQAMYRAKEQGRNRYARASEARTSQVLERAAFQTDLGAALEEDALRVGYRPRIDLADGSMAAACIAAEWVRPGRGSVPLADLQREIEETGLVERVGERLLQTVFGDIAAWRAAGLVPPPVSLPVCRHRFFRPGMWERLRDGVALAGLEPGALELRVPGTVLLQRPEDACETLERLSEAGFHLALDDWGSGGASLGLLRDLPVGAVCVGRALTGSLAEGAESAALLSAVVAMARGLGRPRVVADGVDTAERLALVRRLGCHEAEGPAVADTETAAVFAARIRCPGMTGG